MSGAQGQLFGPAASLPDGFDYVAEFIDADEERALLAGIVALPLAPARYKDYTARRRIASFEDDIAEFLRPLRAKLAAWLDEPETALRHALVNEFRTGTPLGWHRDAPAYGRIAGVSLGGWARMRLRPYEERGAGKQAAVRSLELAPRSAYRMQGPARWSWQHSIPATRELRYSITFRTLRKG